MIPLWPMSTGLNAGLSFSAPLITSVVPNSSGGSSTATFTRATAGTVFDWENILKTVLIGEVRFQGARRVRNASASSETFPGSWTTANSTITSGATDPNGGTTAFTLTATAGNGSISHNGGVTIVVGDIVVNSWYLRRRTGVGTVNVQDNAGLNTVVTLTTAWQRFAVSVTSTGAGQNIAFIIATNGDAVDFWHPQQEVVTGQSNQNPGEYVPNDTVVYAAPFQGAMVAGVQYFNYQNGNTVASNVVTAGTGAAISSTVMLGYLSEEARTNNAIWARDFTNAAWVATTMTKALDQVGIDGVANSASSLLATGANSTVKQTVTIAAVNRPFSVYIKRLTGTGNIDLAQDGATYTTQTVASDSAWHRCTLVASQLNPVLSIRLVTSGDKIAVDYAALEDRAGAAATFPTTPIATTTVAVTRNVDVLTYPSAGNISATTGAAYAEITMEGLSSANNARIFSDTINSSSPLLMDTTGQPRVYDGTTFASSGLSVLVVGTTTKVASSWGGANMKAFSAGVSGNSQAFDGLMGISTMQVGGYTTAIDNFNGGIKNLRVWNVTASDATLLSL